MDYLSICIYISKAFLLPLLSTSFKKDGEGETREDKYCIMTPTGCSVQMEHFDFQDSLVLPEINTMQASYAILDLLAATLKNYKAIRKIYFTCMFYLTQYIQVLSFQYATSIK